MVSAGTVLTVCVGVTQSVQSTVTAVMMLRMYVLVSDYTLVVLVSLKIYEITF